MSSADEAGPMKRPTTILSLAVLSVWGVVYLVTQVITDPPLGVGTTIIAGLLPTLLMTLGFSSVLRGPRSTLSSRRHGSSRSGRTIALMGRSSPLRSGLTAEAAGRTAELLRPMLDVDAVGISDRHELLAFVGTGDDHHVPGHSSMAIATRAMTGARTIVATTGSRVGCRHDDCPLQSGVVAPLIIGSRVVGALGVYRLVPKPPSREVVEGMAGILSLHLELAELDREHNLAVDAKLDALRAQINPHFLFNTLNTIASKARTDPDEARELLLRLSDFFRYAVRQDGHFAEFGQEYFFVRTYLALEQARYEDRLRVHYDVDPQVLTVQVPVLVIQPLVENAVKHGIADKLEGGTVSLKARVDPLTRTITIKVSDDGVGIPVDTLDRITAGEFGSSAGVGLRNISQRLSALFAERYRLDMHSHPGAGTVVELQVPFG
jgi:two-component system LytT family sensor kinase